MNGQCPKRTDVSRVAPLLLLLAVLLAGSVLAALPPAAVLAQGGKKDLSLRLVSRNNYAEITAGESKVLLLELRNTGTEAIREVELSALPPADWRVSFEPDRIPALNPEDSIVAKVTIATSARPARESHEILLRADSADVHRAISVWMTVEKREGMWFWVGGLLAAVVIAGFVLIFIRFGRD